MDPNESSTNSQLNKKLFYQQCSPIFIEYQLMREFVLFQQQGLSHIYVVPSASSAFKWSGVIFIYDGLYAGAIFRFTLQIPSSFPDCDCPVSVNQIH